MESTPYNMRFIDLFAGIGGFRLGFEQAGFECVYSAEINTHCQAVYEKQFGEKPFGDVQKIRAEQLPDYEILLAGFPCQPFSISGKRKGFEDTRGTLFFDICRIIDETHPPVVILENVKYLLHHDGGNTLETILGTLEGFDYFVDYRLLNARHFGVPQNRERVIITATKHAPFDFNDLQKSATPKLRTFLDDDGEFEILEKSEYTLIDSPTIQPSGLIFVGYRNKNTWKTGVRPNTEHLSRVHRQPNRIYSADGVHPTLPSQETSGRFFIYLPEKDMVRKLTLNECYRLMGFPETYPRAHTAGECYKQVGNSVCIPFVAEIARSLNRQLQADYEPSRNPPKRVRQLSFDW